MTEDKKYKYPLKLRIEDADGNFVMEGEIGTIGKPYSEYTKEDWEREREMERNPVKVIVESFVATVGNPSDE